MDAGRGGMIMLARVRPVTRVPPPDANDTRAFREWSAVPWVIDGILVYVDDVDEHTSEPGVPRPNILSVPEDAPYGRYTAWRT